jgi:uncharacterized membrane protein
MDLVNDPKTVNLTFGSPMAGLLEFLRTPAASLVVALAILVVLSVIGFYLVRRYRDSIEDTGTSSELLTKFEESRHRGELNEAEFRTIKTILAERMLAKLKRKDDSG